MESWNGMESLENFLLCYTIYCLREIRAFTLYCVYLKLPLDNFQMGPLCCYRTIFVCRHVGDSIRHSLSSRGLSCVVSKLAIMQPLIISFRNPCTLLVEGT